MRKFYIIILIILSTTYCFAQNKDETVRLNSIIDYLTCVCVNDALPDEVKVDCHNKQLTLIDIPKKESTTIELFNEIQTLKNIKNIKYPLIFFTEEIFADNKKYSKIFAFAHAKKRINKIDVIKSDIKNFIENNNNSETDSNLISDQPNKNSVNSTNEETEDLKDEEVRNYTTPPPPSTFYTFNIWAIISIILFISTVFSLFIFIRQKTVIKNLKKNNNKLIQKNSSHIENDNSFIIENLKQENKILKEKVNELQNSVQNNIEKKASTISEPETPNVVELQLPPKPIEEVFFMATPEQNYFDISSLSYTFKPTQSLYKFTIDNNDKSKATFIFHSDEIGIRDAVNYPHTYLDPVCEPQNALNQNAKNISTDIPGFAEKINDKWVVIKKAKIKYE